MKSIIGQTIRVLMPVCGLSAGSVSAVSQRESKISFVKKSAHILSAGFDESNRAARIASQILANCKCCDFNRSLFYQFRKRLFLTSESRVESVARFDNSTAKKYNPDPTNEIQWSGQTWEECRLDCTLARENLSPQPASR